MGLVKDPVPTSVEGISAFRFTCIEGSLITVDSISVVATLSVFPNNLFVTGVVRIRRVF